jgi:hypothetical protein
MKPTEARKEKNAGAVFYNLYGLQLVKKYDKPKLKIGKIIRYSLKNGEKYALVKWKGWNDKFNSWEPV